MTGAGVTKIDTILANPLGAAAVKSSDYLRDNANLFDHVPLRVTLCTQRTQQSALRAGRPIGLDVKRHLYLPPQNANADKKRMLREAAEKTYARVWATFGNMFAQAEADGAQNETLRIWSLVAELWLFMSQVDECDPNKDQDIDDFYKRGIPRRGQPMPIRSEPLVPKFLDEGRDAGVLGIENAILKLCAAAKSIVQLCKAEQKDHEEIRINRCTKPQALYKAWKELENCVHTRADNANTQEMAEVLASRAIQQVDTALHPDELVSKVANTATEVLQIARTEHTRVCTRAAQKRRSEMREVLSDPNRGHSSSFKTLKADQYEATTVLQVDGQLTSNSGAIMQSFVKQWKTVYNRLETAPPEYTEFEEHYGDYMHFLPTGDLIPNAEQLQAAAARAKADSAAGSDAWRPAELALLPAEAWVHRASVLRVITSAGKWPDAYLEVISPCLGKKDKLDTEAERPPPISTRPQAFTLMHADVSD